MPRKNLIAKICEKFFAAAVHNALTAATKYKRIGEVNVSVIHGALVEINGSFTCNRIGDRLHTKPIIMMGKTRAAENLLMKILIGVPNLNK